MTDDGKIATQTAKELIESAKYIANDYNHAKQIALLLAKTLQEYEDYYTNQWDDVMEAINEL